MAGQPHPRPASSRKRRKLSADEMVAIMNWKVDGRKPGHDPHHAIDAQVLRHMGFADREWDPRNKLWVPRQIHAGHTTRMHPLFRDELPDPVWDFALELDSGDLDGYFTNWLCRTYPVREDEAA